MPQRGSRRGLQVTILLKKRFLLRGTIRLKIKIFLKKRFLLRKRGSRRRLKTLEGLYIEDTAPIAEMWLQKTSEGHCLLEEALIIATMRHLKTCEESYLL